MQTRQHDRKSWILILLLYILPDLQAFSMRLVVILLLCGTFFYYRVLVWSCARCVFLDSRKLKVCQFQWWKILEGNVGGPEQIMSNLIPHCRDQSKYESCHFADITQGLFICTHPFPRRSRHAGHLSCLERQPPRLNLFRIPSNIKEDFCVPSFCLPPSPVIS